MDLEGVIKKEELCDSLSFGIKSEPVSSEEMIDTEQDSTYEAKDTGAGNPNEVFVKKEAEDVFYPEESSTMFDHSNEIFIKVQEKAEDRFYPEELDSNHALEDDSEHGWTSPDFNEKKLANLDSGAGFHVSGASYLQLGPSSGTSQGRTVGTPWTDDINLRSASPQTKQKSHTCPYCESKYADKSYLRRHIASKHFKDKHLSCPQCEYSCMSTSHLKNHIMAKHTKERPYPCPHCEYNCADRSNLKRHVMYRHIKDKSFSCPHCKYTCVTCSNLKVHIKLKHTKDKPLSCPHCEYRCVLGSNLKYHIMLRHTKENFISCSHCEYSCLKKARLKKHIMAKHTKEKPLSCPNCEFRCIDKCNLKRHITSKHTEHTSPANKESFNAIDPNHFLQGPPPGIDQSIAVNNSNMDELEVKSVFPIKKRKLLTCSHCEYTCVIKTHLKNHIMAKHTKEKPLSCPNCEFRCIDKSNLKRHIMSKHTKLTSPGNKESFNATDPNNFLLGPSTRIAQSNDAGNSCMNDLEVMSISPINKQKSLTCPHCDYISADIRNFRRHILSKHTKEKPLSCPHCDYRCVHSVHLKNHIMAKHTKEKPLPCPNCEFRCIDKSNLKRHIMSKHTKLTNPGNKESFNATTDLNHFLKGPSTGVYQSSAVDNSSMDDLEVKSVSPINKRKPLTCSHCEYSCGNKIHLKNHIMAKHTKEKPLPCPNCEYRCINKSNLKRHIMSKHRSPANKESFNAIDLNNYLQGPSNGIDQSNAVDNSHMDELEAKSISSINKDKPLTCSYCEYSCVIKAHLKNHIMAKHTKEKPLSCPNCEFRCVDKSNLKRHIISKHTKFASPANKESFNATDLAQLLPRP